MPIEKQIKKETTADNAPFKESHRSLVGISFYLMATVAVLSGLLLKTLSLGKVGFLWEMIGEVGTFLAVTFAVAFIYERVIRHREHLHVLDDIGRLLDEKLGDRSEGVSVYEYGRPTLQEKLNLYLQAKEEVLEIGTTLRTFAGYFEQHPAAEFRDHIVKLLASGVHFKCFLNSPKSLAAREDEKELEKKLADSLQRLSSLASEFKSFGFGGSFSVSLYSTPSNFAAIVIDGLTEHGQIIFSPYLFGLRYAESPAFHIRKSTHPVLFSKILVSLQNRLRDAERYDPAEESSRPHNRHDSGSKRLPT